MDTPKTSTALLIQDIRERLVKLETVVFFVGGPVALLLVVAACKVLFFGVPAMAAAVAYSSSSTVTATSTAAAPDVERVSVTNSSSASASWRPRMSTRFGPVTPAAKVTNDGTHTTLPAMDAVIETVVELLGAVPSDTSSAQPPPW